MRHWRRLMKRKRRFLAPLMLVVLISLLVPAAALADGSVHTTPSIPLPEPLIWSVIAAWFSPLLTGFLTSGFWSKIPQYLQDLIHAVGAGVVSAVAQLLTSSSFGWNESTLGIITVSVLTALAAAHPFWSKNEIGVKLGLPRAPNPK